MTSLIPLDPYAVDSETDDDDRTVINECSECLSTPGKNNCICPPHVKYGLQDDRCLATLDHQVFEYDVYEYRHGAYTLRLPGNGPLVEQDIWMEEIATRRWSLLYRAETTVLDLAKFIARKFDPNVLSLIKSYFKSAYYGTGKQYPFFQELYSRYFMECDYWDNISAQTAYLAYGAPMRGYCMRCGEPAVNNRSPSGVATYISIHARHRYRTIKYGLGVMGLCHRCLVLGYQYDIFNRGIEVPVAIKKNGALVF